MRESKEEIEKRIRVEQGITEKIFWCDECEQACDRRHCLDGPSTGCEKTFKPIPTTCDLGGGVVVKSRPSDWALITFKKTKIKLSAEQAHDLKWYLDRAF